MEWLEPEHVAGLSAPSRHARATVADADVEWPLVYIEEHHALLVVREWPDGSVTACTMSRSDLESRTDGGQHG